MSFLEEHRITEFHRMRLLDWMVQVYRVLKVSAPQTFFLSAKIFDRYLIEKQKNKESIFQEDLYLIGLSCVFISSKYEDVVPIRMIQIL